MAKWLIIALFLLTTNIAAQGKRLTSQPVSLYLSFDDGPMDSSHFLDSLIIKDSVPVTVFVVGFRVNANAGMRSRLEMYRQQELVEIGNHSYSHAAGHYKLFYTNPSQVVNDVVRNADSLSLRNNIVRLPGRNTWRIQNRKRTDLTDANAAADSLSSLGYTLLGWDLEWKIDTCENRYSTAEEMISQINRLIHSKRSFEKDHVVILCHDWALSDLFFREQLAAFVQKIREDDCMHFSPLANYPGVKQPEAILTITDKQLNNHKP